MKEHLPAALSDEVEIVILVRASCSAKAEGDRDPQAQAVYDALLPAFDNLYGYNPDDGLPPQEMRDACAQLARGTRINLVVKIRRDGRLVVIGAQSAGLAAKPSAVFIPEQMAFDLVPETCTAVDFAIDRLVRHVVSGADAETAKAECAQIVKGRTGALRRALINQCVRVVDLQAEVRQLKGIETP